MSMQDFAIVFATCLVTMLICRCVPLFVLKGRQLPEGLARALGFIPPAAFAALVANDLLSPGMFDAGLWPAAMPRQRPSSWRWHGRPSRFCGAPSPAAPATPRSHSSSPPACSSAAAACAMRRLAETSACSLELFSAS